MELISQPCLLDDPPDRAYPSAEPVSPGVASGSAGQVSHRHDLSDGAWVDVVPGWWPAADGVFGRLVRSADWRTERRQMYDRVVDVPRLVAFYGARDAWPDPALYRMRDALNQVYGDLDEPLVTAGLCLYRDGNDSVAWHGDRIGRGRTHDTVVAIVSLGSPRALLLRPRGGGPSQRFVVGHGDLFVMGGSCQRTWEHAVPKSSRSMGPRVSVQFRPRGVL